MSLYNRKYKIGLIPGDTVGPELIASVREVLEALEDRAGIVFEITDICACGEAIERFGTPLPEEEAKKAEGTDAVFFGNIGAKKYQSFPPDERPEAALLKVRKIMNVGSSVRPIRIRKGLEECSPLKNGFLSDGMTLS